MHGAKRAAANCVPTFLCLIGHASVSMPCSCFLQASAPYRSVAAFESARHSLAFGPGVLRAAICNLTHEQRSASSSTSVSSSLTAAKLPKQWSALKAARGVSFLDFFYYSSPCASYIGAAGDPGFNRASCMDSLLRPAAFAQLHAACSVLICSAGACKDRS